MFKAPSSDNLLLILNLPVKWFYRGLRLFSDVWRENAKFVMKVLNRHKRPRSANTNFRDNHIWKLDHFQTARIVFFHLNWRVLLCYMIYKLLYSRAMYA